MNSNEVPKWKRLSEELERVSDRDYRNHFVPRDVGPAIRIEETGFGVVQSRKPSVGRSPELSPRQQQLLNSLSDEGGKDRYITTAMVSEELGVVIKTADRLIKDLVNRRLMVPKGRRGKRGQWYGLNEDRQ